jgi:leucyl-tRNA synthetase
MRLGRRFSIVDRPWPVADATVAREAELELAVQLNGKVRGRITISADTVEEEVKARALEAVKHLIDGKPVTNVRVIPGRLVSVVTQ